MATTPGNLSQSSSAVRPAHLAPLGSVETKAPGASRPLDRALRVLPLPAFVLDEAGRLVDGNPALLALLGATGLDDVRPDWITEPALRRVLRMLQREGRVQGYHVRLQRAAGSSRPAAVSAVRVRRPGERPSVQGVVVDLAPERELRHQLLEARRVDHLTGCRNRLFVAELAALCDPGSSVWAVVAADVVGFRALNRELGTRAGDEALRRLAAVLQAALRPGDAAVRLAGDTFALILLDADEATTDAVREQIERAAAALHPSLILRTACTLRDGREPLERTLARAEDGLRTPQETP